MKKPSRRTALKTTAAAAAVATTSAMALDAVTYANVPGANERINIAFLGVGGRCQQHIDDILAMQRANANSVRPDAVCDVWDGNPQLGRRPDGGFNGRGLNPSALRCGLRVNDAVHVTKDYRRLLGLREVDAVCIATPDHWHAKMTIDAAGAGKHIYCEKPFALAKTDAIAMLEACRRAGIVLGVGHHFRLMPSMRVIDEIVKGPGFGTVMHIEGNYSHDWLANL